MSPAVTAQVPVLQLATIAEKEKDVSSWFDRHGENLVMTPLRILLIILVALVIRAVVRKLISQLISRMATSSSDSHGRPMTGFLLNAERRRQRTETLGSVLRSVSSFVIMSIAALMVLSEFKIDLTPLLASAGIAGVAIGFGARNLVTDFLSGIFMILEDQYGVGDLVDAGAATGTVVEVGLRVTKLRDADGAVWYIRNGEIKRVGNHSQGWGTSKVDVQVGYHEDTDKIRDIILTATEDLADSEEFSEYVWGPAEVVGMEAVAADSVVMRVQVKTMPGQEAIVARELRARLKHAFDDAGVRISEAVVVASPATGTDAGVVPAPAEPSPAPPPAAPPA